MADRSLNEDVGFWLRSVVALPQAARAERALRENMVENGRCRAFHDHDLLPRKNATHIICLFSVSRSNKILRPAL